VVFQSIAPLSSNGCTVAAMTPDENSLGMHFPP
jgi:hypothetical protein